MLMEFTPSALDMFKKKGIGNAPKVRRIMQLTDNLKKKPIEELRILDLGCGEGLYSLEVGLRGAKVLGLDGRDDRLKEGVRIAEEMGLSNVEFKVDDIRNLSKEKYGIFDIIYYFGLLYHLDVPDVFKSIEACSAMNEHMLIIDSTIALSAPETVEYKGEKYKGLYYVEHRLSDSESMKKERVMHSIGNDKSFLLTRKSLYKFLVKNGYNTIMECHAPFEPAKLKSRITLVCLKSSISEISSFPMLNGMNLEEIDIMFKNERTKVINVINFDNGIKFKLKKSVDKFVGLFGYELKKKLIEE